MFCVVVLYSLKFDHADCIDDVVVDDDMIINGSTFWKLSISFFLLFTRVHAHARTHAFYIIYTEIRGSYTTCYSRRVCLGIVKQVKCIRVHFLFIF